MSLLTLARYVTITGDDYTTQATVTARIEDAEAELAEELGRPLEEAERTEAMRPSRHGMLWPRATPIAAADGYAIKGLGLSAGQIGVVTNRDPIDVTYTGGWTTGNIPRCIERDLAWVTYALINPTVARERAGTPADAASISLGDVSVTFRDAGSGSVGDALIRWSRRTLNYRYSVPRGT